MASGKAQPSIYYVDEIATNRGLIKIKDLQPGDVVYDLSGKTRVVEVKKLPEQSTIVRWSTLARNNSTVFSSSMSLVNREEVCGVTNLPSGWSTVPATIKPPLHDEFFPYDPYTFGAWFSMGEIMDNFVPMHEETKAWFDLHGASIPVSLMYGPVEDRIAFLNGAVKWGLALRDQSRWSWQRFVSFGWGIRYEHPNPAGDRVSMMNHLLIGLGARTKVQKDPLGVLKVEAEWIMNPWDGTMVVGSSKILSEYYSNKVEVVEEFSDREWFLPVTESGTVLVGSEMVAIDAR